jgi:TetR/AcrR family transcriptional repressor of nem operon
MYVFIMDAKDKLIETTRQLLWERGYVATSPKQIQKLSGVGQGSMYHHFKGKADLALESIRRNASDMQRITAERLSRGTTTLEKIKSFLLKHRNVFLGCRIGGLTYDPDIIAKKSMRSVLKESFDWLHSELTMIIRSGQKNGDFDKTVDADAIASTISAALQGGYVLAKASGSEKPFHQAINGLIQLLESHNQQGGSYGRKNRH